MKACKKKLERLSFVLGVFPRKKKEKRRGEDMYTTKTFTTLPKTNWEKP